MMKINRVKIIILLIGIAISLNIDENRDAKQQIKTSQLQSQYVPISKRYPGLLIGPQNGQITIQLVYDPVCDGSANMEVVFKQFLAGLDQATRAKLNIRYLINALPYHILAYKITTAIRYVNDQLGGQTAADTLRYFLKNINQWGETSTTVVTASINSAMNNIAGAVSTLTGLSKDNIRKQIAHNSATQRNTRQMVKYTMGTLRTPGTPLMFINGARVDDAASMNSTQIGELIKKLLS